MSYGANVFTIGEFDQTGREGVMLDRSTLMGAGANPTMVASSIKLNESETIPVAADTLNKQLQGFTRFPTARNVKTGRLGGRENIETVASFFEDQDMNGVNFLVDASLDAGEDRPWLTGSAISLVRMRLLPLATVVIAYLSEAARLAGIEVTDITQMKEAAEAIHIYGPGVVVVRADEPVDDEWIDIYFDGTEHQFLFRKTVGSADIRGGRDVFASAAVAYMAQGRGPLHSIELAQQFEASCSATPQEKPA